jgi:hypothetical protein
VSLTVRVSDDPREYHRYPTFLHVFRFIYARSEAAPTGELIIDGFFATLLIDDDDGRAFRTLITVI